MSNVKIDQAFVGTSRIRNTGIQRVLCRCVPHRHRKPIDMRTNALSGVSLKAGLVFKEAEAWLLLWPRTSKKIHTAVPRFLHCEGQCRLSSRLLRLLHMQLFMESYDIILSPTTAVTADKLLADDIEFDPSKHNMDHAPFGYLFNLTHQPAVTVPVGINQLGMPISVQIAGKVGDDALVLGVAKLIESMWPMPHSPFFD